MQNTGALWFRPSFFVLPSHFKRGSMNTLTETNVRLFASAKSWIEGEALRQLYATSKLEGMRLAVGFPDLHPGKGSAVGAAFVTEGLLYPYLIGGDIGCGMALFKTDLVQRDIKLNRWPICASTWNIPGRATCK